MKRTISTLLITLLLMSSTVAITYATEAANTNEINKARDSSSKVQDIELNNDISARSSAALTSDDSGSLSSGDIVGDGSSGDTSSDGCNSGDTSGDGDSGGSGDTSGDDDQGTGGSDDDGNTPAPEPEKPKYVNQFVKQGSYTYYYDNDGQAIKNSVRKINDSYYYFDASGHMTTGKWVTWNGGKYYFQNSGKAYMSCSKKIGKYTYRFNKYAKAYRNSWYKTSSGKKYYYNKYGHKLYGKHSIQGKKYYFNRNGVLLASNTMDIKAQSYSSKSKYLILVNTKTNVTRIYSGAKGNWRRIKNWSCTTGKKSTPTVKGSFTIGRRGGSFGHGYTCWYWTQFKNDYLFHSVIYNPGSKKSLQDGRLGKNLSHGCVRLSISNAKWIYKHIPSKTKTIVY